MRDRLLLPWILAGAFGAAAGGALAQESSEAGTAPAAKPEIGRLAFAAKVGSNGPAADLTWAWTPQLHGRVSASYEPNPDHEEDDTIRASASLLLDWHPGGGSFRLSGGLAYVRREFLDASLPAGYFGTDEVWPYFGIGWGNPFRAGSRWGFVVDLGAFWGGGISHSDSDIRSASTLAASEKSSTKVSVSWKAVVSTGVSFRF